MTKQLDISTAAAALGREGGKSTSAAKQAAARENGKKGGRPRKETKMANKKHYYAWASNDQGASMDVAHGTSAREMEDEARRTMGSGWTIHIMRVENGVPEEVKTFKIR